MTKKERAADRLLKAAGSFVNAHGGTALVGGGIGITHQETFKFQLVINMTGKPPVKEAA